MPSPRISELQAIADPIERAAACQRFILATRETLRTAEATRNEAIRAARERTHLSIDKLATRMKVNRSLIVEALRPAKGDAR